ncbi:Lin0512 family protein [Bacillus alkalicellulosilyticus]|uniref:Lin0512 family protein n=1 Tax=Alkalihalobacterium alkalicellulosilyticum TaxID=1912214 RepID=UPI000998B5E4|nr:Lin0512 family protein [Bacillus alkalicellulosilyticus]
MLKIMFIQTGMGVDLHGQDVTTAAKRAVENAIHSNSMPGLRSTLPDNDINQMKVHVKLAIPFDEEKLDEDAIKELLPYGTVTIETMKGGMATTSGVILKDKGDKNDLMYIVVASIEVGF